MVGMVNPPAPPKEIDHVIRKMSVLSAAAALTIAILNLLIAPDSIGTTFLERLLSPNVSLVIGIGLVALLPLLWKSLRWFHPLLFVGTGLGSTMTATGVELTGLAFFIVGALLMWHYGYLEKQPGVRVGVLVGVYLGFVLLSSITGENDTVARAVVTITGATFVSAAGSFVLVDHARRDARHRQELERAVELRTQELSSALADRELLLSEIHHRTKNNLQLVSTVLSFEDGRIGPEVPGQALAAGTMRIRALARVHDLLYASVQNDTVDISTFLSSYFEEMMIVAGCKGIRIASWVDKGVKAQTDVAIRLALMLNEIVMNTVEHAGSVIAEPVLEVRVAKRNHSIVLTTHDNGPGLDSDVNERIGLGMHIIRSIAGALGGEADVSSSGGVGWEIMVPVQQS